MDVYVWIPSPSPEVLARFIEEYVSGDGSAEQHLNAFQRVYVHGTGTAADAEQLAGQCPPGRTSFTLYLRAHTHDSAMITITEDNAAVLGLSIPDEDGEGNDPQPARNLIHRLREQFAAPAGLAGVELAPPHSLGEWLEDEMVLVREGHPLAARDAFRGPDTGVDVERPVS